MLQYLSIDMVWLIVKSKPGSGFQKWHQDFNLNEKITKTIVINLGAVKRSDLLGGPLSEVAISENKDNEAKGSARDILGGQMLCGFINSDSEDKEGKVSAMKGMETERRDDAMAKRNRKQESQAIKAMKQCGRAAQAAGAGIGAVVSLKVDYRTHSHAQGLLAIVYEMKERYWFAVSMESSLMMEVGRTIGYPMTSMTSKQGHRTHAQLRRLFSQYATWFWKVSTTQLINEEFHIQSIMRRRLDQ
jgi:hypothetical protein